MTQAPSRPSAAIDRSRVLPATREPATGWWVLVLLAVYAAGLTQQVTSPWGGMHDWNGAFYSQLARNLLRYPVDVHRGMGVLAVGADVPPIEERGLYSHHPPGLVWLVAGAFRLFGESEAVARAVPIAASLAAFWMLIVLTVRRWGRETAMCAGLLYALMPMSVYFGRMVNHEAVCLCLMLAAVLAWQAATDRAPDRKPTGVYFLAAWGTAVAALIWIDWVGVVFAGLFCIRATLCRDRQGHHRGRLAFAWALPIGAAAGMLCHLVDAGLDGQWDRLWAIFVSRRVSDITPADRVAWNHLLGNLTWPVLALAVLGAASDVAGRFRRQTSAQEPPDRSSAAAGWGLCVIALTGLIWVALFWRLFKIHNYWMFYLGPWVGLSAAKAVVILRDAAARRFPTLAVAAFYAAIAMVAAVELTGVQQYFARKFLPDATMAAWREVNRQTRPAERVLLHWNPVQFDRYGTSGYRTIVPPQLAYYMDRAFDVQPDATQAVAVGAASRALYVVPQQVVLTNPDAFRAVGHLPATPSGDLLLIRLGGEAGRIEPAP
jgi:hypothetical protein